MRGVKRLVVLLLVVACGGGKGGGVTTPVPTAPLEWVDGPAGKLRVDDGGTGGVPVVFVHGLAGRHEVWAAQLAHVRTTRRAVALDLRGMGQSDPSGDGRYAVDDMVADVAAVVDRLGIQRFVLVGHSYGGAVVGAFAARYPERVVGVVFADPVGDLTQLPQAERDQFVASLGPETFAAASQAWYEEILTGAAPGVKETVLAALRATPRDVFMGVMGDMVRYDPKPALAAYRGPRLDVVADASKDFPIGLHHVVPDLPVRVMTGVSHWLMMDKPDEFNGLLDEFLAGR